MQQKFPDEPARQKQSATRQHGPCGVQKVIHVSPYNLHRRTAFHGKRTRRSAIKPDHRIVQRRRNQVPPGGPRRDSFSDFSRRNLVK